MMLMRGAPDFGRVFGPDAGGSLLRSPQAVTNRNSASMYETLRVVPLALIDQAPISSQAIRSDPP